MPADFITRDSEILGGAPVFAGTRVPVRTLFDYLEDDFSLAEFLEFFPSVPRSLALAVLEEAGHKLIPSDASTPR
jgi:uncharacterized protein (DUF433 family)